MCNNNLQLLLRRVKLLLHRLARTQCTTLPADGIQATPRRRFRLCRRWRRKYDSPRPPIRSHYNQVNNSLVSITTHRILVMSTACNFSSFATHDHQHWFIYYLAMFLLDQKLEVEKQPERDWGIIMGGRAGFRVFG